MRKALLFITNGGTIREAGRKFGIPESTIRKRKKDYDGGLDVTGPQMGRHPIFSVDQEKSLTSHVIKMAKLFYGVSKTQLRKLAYSYALSNNIPNNFNATTKMAGKDWYYHFLKRNKVISLRKPEPTSINRISAFNETQVNQFFQNLKKLYEKYHFSNEKIFNVDETGISTMQKPSKRVGPKGIKQFGAKTSAERGKTVTVICCFNAAGTCYVPPMFIFPRTRTTTLEKNGPPNAKYSCSKSGWSNEQLFYEWLQHFIDIVKPSKDHPVLIILDNHSSHISIAIYECCKQNGIVLLTIPPHTSHRLQPLDLTFYGPLKAAFYRQCDNYLLHFERITPYDLAELFHKAYSQVATMDKAQSGFKTPGIWPFDSEKFTKEDFLASNHHTPTDEDLDETVVFEGTLEEFNNSAMSQTIVPSLSTSVRSTSTESRDSRGKRKRSANNLTDDTLGALIADASKVLSSVANKNVTKDVIDMLGDDPESTAENGSLLHNELAKRWKVFLQNGLKKDDLLTILSKYDTPSNLSLLTAPILNPEVKAALQKPILSVDFSHSEGQNQLGKGLCALGKAISNILGNIESIPGDMRSGLLTDLFNSGRILTNLFHRESVIRKNLITPHLKNLQAVAEKCMPAEFLFGTDLSEKLKSLKAIESASKELKSVPKPFFNRKRGGDTVSDRSKPGSSRPLNAFRPVRHYPETRPARSQKFAYRSEPAKTYRNKNQSTWKKRI
ncbi:hypothetical protein PPYR_00119 [Photinus pyralis]|uniref:DDE-1 domain-containing protein n=2 Tax=Photinus pyralis TaxID=7054 RepID=A0A5N4B0M3_PHOPY|nr:hypothetical protein PPYR_00119 [Photinus pyralis]